MERFRMDGLNTNNRLRVALWVACFVLILFLCPIGQATVTVEREEPMLKPPLPSMTAQAKPHGTGFQQVRPVVKAAQAVPVAVQAAPAAKPTPSKPMAVKHITEPAEGTVSGAAAPIAETIAPTPSEPEEDLVSAQPAMTDSAEATSTPVHPEELVPLDSVLKKDSAYASSGYFYKLFGALALLLIGFYLTARVFLPKMFQDSQRPIGLSSAGGGHRQPQLAMPNPSLWDGIMASFGSAVADGGLTPKILSRQRLSPGKELHVVQVRDRILVLASTASQVTVITELPLHAEAGLASRPEVAEEEDVTPEIHISGDPQIHKKYLNRKFKIHQARQPQITEQAMAGAEEVYMLDDYEEVYE